MSDDLADIASQHCDAASGEDHTEDLGHLKVAATEVLHVPFWNVYLLSRSWT